MRSGVFVLLGLFIFRPFLLSQIVGTPSGAKKKTTVETAMSPVGAVRLPNNVAITARNAAGSGDLGIIKLNANDAVEIPVVTLENRNTAAGMEWGSLTAGGTPFIDFHSSGNNNDYDVRLIASRGTHTAGAGILTLDAAMVAPKATGRGLGTNNARWDIFGRFADFEYTTTDASGASPQVRLKLNDNNNKGVAGGSANTVLDVRAEAGSGGQLHKGNIHSILSEIIVTGAAPVRNYGNEYTPLITHLRNNTSTATRLWGLDFGVHSSRAAPEDLLQGPSFVVNKFHASAYRNGSIGAVVYTKPGTGPGVPSGTTYPLDVGLLIAGWSGTVAQHGNDPANAALDARGAGFTTGIRIGGAGGGWDSSWLNDRSRIVTGLHIRDVTSAAIKLDNPYGGTTPPTPDGLVLSGSTWRYGMDFTGATFSASGAAIRLPNNVVVSARNAADSADVGLFKLNVSNEIELSQASLVNKNNNAALELGSLATSNTPFMDFHSSGNNIDYDSRLIASGGAGSSGNGTLIFDGAVLAPNATGRDLGTAGMRWDLFADSADINSIELAPTSFANLGTPRNGTVKYCADCTKATPCAARGTGALAKRLNGAWDCD